MFLRVTAIYIYNIIFNWKRENIIWLVGMIDKGRKEVPDVLMTGTGLVLDEIPIFFAGILLRMRLPVGLRSCMLSWTYNRPLCWSWILRSHTVHALKSNLRSCVHLPGLFVRLYLTVHLLIVFTRVWFVWKLIWPVRFLELIIPLLSAPLLRRMRGTVASVLSTVIVASFIN